MTSLKPRLLHTAPDPDPELLQRLAAGELGALGELYDRYQHPVRRYLAHATADAEDVDDLVQATFLTAAKSAVRYDGRDSARPWLIGIATRLLRRRRRAFGRLFEILLLVGSTRSPSVDPRASVDAKSDIERALARLSEAKRVTFLMAEVEEMSCAEIARVLEIPIGTVWTRLHAARRELRAELDGREP